MSMLEQVTKVVRIDTGETVILGWTFYGWQPLFAFADRATFKEFAEVIKAQLEICNKEDLLLANLEKGWDNA